MSGPNLVIAGSSGLLADHVARIAAAGGANVVRLAEGSPCPPDAEVWYFAGSASVDLHRFRGARSLNLVVTPYCGDDPWRWLRRDESDSSDPASLTRLFTTSLTVAEDGSSREGFLHFLATLFDLKTEIDERMADYFEHRALRFHAPGDARVNLIRTERAAELMLAIAARAGAGHYVIASPVSDPLVDVLERAGSAAGISLLSEDDRERLTAIDALFELRLAGFARTLEPPPPELVEESCRAAGIDAATLIVDEEAQRALFDSVLAARQEGRRAFVDRAGAFPAALRRVELRGNGKPLVYYAAGSGARTIVLLNAFGQALDFWFRLIEQLRPRFKVLIAEGPSLGSVAELADELDAMLANENTEECHLVGWCTGPRVGVEYALRRPERVRSMVFLNTSLRCTGGPPEFCSAFESNFDVLMRMLEERPALAASMMASLQASAGNGDGVDELLADVDEDVAPRILARINASLRAAVAAPFASAESFLRLTRGIDELWRYDIREKAAAIDVPVLFLSAEHDRVAMPAGSPAAAECFPRGRHVHVPGATHYFLYDRPEVTAALIEAFFADPEAVGERVYSFGHSVTIAATGVGP